MIRIRSQAGSDYYDPSFVTETLREIQYSDTRVANQDISLLKDVAVQAYVGQSAHFISYRAIFQREQIALLRQSKLFFGDGLLSRGAEGSSNRT